MLILSTFNSEYSKSPLQHLIKKFTTESVEIKYVNNNIVTELISLQSSLEFPPSIAILLRLFDLTKNCKDKMANNPLIENLQLIIEQINALKKKKSLPLIVFLCPSPEKFYNEELGNIEKYFLDTLQGNKIHTLTQSDIQKHYLLNKFYNPVECETHIPYTPEFYVAKACLLARKLHALIKKYHKVIVVDCDNTLWTGAAGEAGTEKVFFNDHNIALQEFLVNQHASGIIICLCSKNEEQTVLDVFRERKKEMPLKIEHVTKYKINWDLKSTNIANLASELNLSLGSFVFIDDNSFEIREVRKITGVLCVTMPQRLDEFNHTWAFDINEHLLLTETDRNRSKFYKQLETKTALAVRFLDPIEYLRSVELGQSIIISKVTSVNDIAIIERVCELSGRTNQFNLFPEAKEFSEIEEMISNDKKEVFVGRISDKLSAEADITAIALCAVDEGSLKVNSFFVSCRSFGRGIEYELIKHIAEFAAIKQLSNIEIRFKKTAKNKVATTFLNVLSEKKLIQVDVKFLYKSSNICLDFNALEVDDAFNLTLAVEKLRNLPIDSLIRATLKANQVSKVQADQKISLNSYNEVSENYLVELRKMTSSLDYLLKKFFVDICQLELIANLEGRVITLCNNLLGEQGQDKSLVSRGLDSIKATQLCGYLYKSDRVSIDVTKLLCEKTTVINLIEFIKTEKKTLKNKSEMVLTNDSFYNQTMPVSFQQKRLWMAEQKEDIKNSSNYHMLACYTISNLDIDRFKAACQQLIERYDVFGAKFSMDRGELLQSILPPTERELKLEVKDLGQEGSPENAIKEVIRKPLSMSDYPLIRFVLFKDQPNRNYHILFHVHHAIFDAVSLKNCLDDLSILYKNTLTSTPLSLPIPYMEFVQAQKKKCEDEDYQEKAKQYWSEQLAKIETIAEFPYDQANVTFKLATERKAERYNFLSTQGDFSALKSLAQIAGVTRYSVIGTLFGLLISAYAYQDNVAIITATNGRSGNPSFHKMIGFFINLLVQNFDLSANKDKTFIEYLKENHEKFLEAQEHQDISFEEIQKILSQQGVNDILLSPALIYQSYEIPQLILGGELAKLTIPEQPIIFDMRKTCRFGHFTLFAQEDKVTEQLNLVIEYAKDLYSVHFIERIANNFKYLIATVANNPEQRLSEISVVCEQERQELLRVGQGPELEYAVNNLLEGFQRSVKNNPNNTAICHNEITFSYTKLDEVSDELAYFLYKKGIAKGDNVGIACHRNHLFFIAELAILKRGAVFVPLSMQDPDDDRLRYIIENASIKHIVGDIELTQKDKAMDFNFINIQAVMNQVGISGSPVLKGKPQPKINREDRACILYTSGSTGNPKGVILKHKGILRVVASPNFMEVSHEDKVAQMANEAFDAAQLECWLAWNNGASLVIIDKEVMLNPINLQQKLSNQGITIVWLTAALFHHYASNQPDLFKQLKYLLVGGDEIYIQAVKNVLKAAGEKPPRIINGYGPTETSIFALTYYFNKETLDECSIAPIGRPINNTTVKILTQFRQLAPLGGLGELLIAGDGVAEAYLGLSDMTEKYFISSEENPEIKKYKSGDLVKWAANYPDKNIVYEIQFLGRINQEQIKINGVLVALTGIEKIMAQHPVAKQVTVLHEANTHRKVLRAFYTKNEALPTPTQKDWSEYLKDKLPPIMKPASYTEISEFPITRNGKLDRKKLLAYPLEISHKNHSTETLTDNEQKVLDIFREGLSVQRFTINDDFNQYGGTSIQAMQLIAEVKNIFNKNISFNDLCQNSSVKSLVHFLELENNESLTGSSLCVLKKEEDSQLPPIVFIHPAGGGLSCFKKLIAKLAFYNLCCGVEDPLLDRNELMELSMKDMAANYLFLVQKKIKGPFILAGYSFGGMLALEMAAQLEQSGQKESLLGVILLDTWVVSCASEDIKSGLKKQVLDYCAKQREKASRNQKSGEGLGETSATLMGSLERICAHHQEIGFEFKPKKLDDTPVRLLQATQLDENFLKMASKDKDKKNYLSEFVNEKLFGKKEIEATHFNLLENLSIAKIFSEQVTELCKERQKEATPIDSECAEKSSVNTVRAFFNNTKVNEEVSQCNNEKYILKMAK